MYVKYRICIFRKTHLNITLFLKRENMGLQNCLLHFIKLKCLGTKLWNGNPTHFWTCSFH